MITQGSTRQRKTLCYSAKSLSAAGYPYRWRAASRHAIGREMTCVAVRRALLAPLVGQNDDYKKSSTGKRIVINQNHNLAFSERGCRHFPQVRGAAHLAPVSCEE